jgi:hypothetical protein
VPQIVAQLDVTPYTYLCRKFKKLLNFTTMKEQKEEKCRQIITAKELEQDMDAIFDRIDAGEEIFIQNENRFYKMMLVE